MSGQTKTIDDVTYEIRELRLRDVEDLLSQEGVNFSKEIFKRAVYHGGAPIGDAADEMPLRIYSTLLKIVNKANMPEAEPEPGKE